MIDDLHTFLGSISEEIDSSTVEILLVGFSIHDISLDRAHLLQGTIHHLGIDFHSAGIKHRNDKRIFLSRMLTEQYRNSHQFERRDGDELHITAIADSLRHTDSDAETGIRTRTATYRHSLQRNTMGIYETKSLIYVNT